MGSYIKTAMRIFGELSGSIISYFPELVTDLKKARVKISIQEFISEALFTCFLVFLLELPALSFIFSFFLKSFLFSFLSSFTVSIFLTVIIFFAFINYPKVIIKEKAKQVDNALPFSTLYLSTISGSKLPLYRVLQIFVKFAGYGQISNEFGEIVSDMETFGLDVNSALERAIERTTSKSFKELLWGVLSTNRTGGDMDIYLKEKAKNYVEDYRRKLYEFSHSLSMFIEIYLTAIIMGAIFFTILTAIMSGIAGGSTGGIIILQFLLIFIFIPGISMAFVVLIKSATPGGE